GDVLSYVASGLPTGLSINGTSGLISGAVDYAAAETQGGRYTVTVSVSDPTHTTTSSFSWTVIDTPRPPSLTKPANQANAEGQAVSLQLSATDPDGLTLTYGGSGLPAGLSVNSTSGRVS